MAFKFNKVVSTFMEFYNTNKGKSINQSTAKELTEMIRCFAPSF